MLANEDEAVVYEQQGQWSSEAKLGVTVLLILSCPFLLSILLTLTLDTNNGAIQTTDHQIFVRYFYVHPQDEGIFSGHRIAEYRNQELACPTLPYAILSRACDQAIIPFRQVVPVEQRLVRLTCPNGHCLKDRHILSPNIGQFTELQQLDLNNHAFTTLPSEIGYLTKLEMLALSHNILIALPPNIGQLVNLKELFISHNVLLTLPPEIGKLSQLRVLYANDNGLTYLPPEIGQLTELRALNLSNNNLTTLPPEIGQLTHLETLIISGNPIQTLPPEINQLPNLKVVD